MVEVVRKRQVDLPSQSIINRETLGGFPGVLGVSVKRLVRGIDEASIRLCIAVRNPQQEICAREARAERTRSPKIKGTAVVEEEGIRHFEAPGIDSELQSVFPNNVAEVVVDLVGLVNAWLRPVSAEAQGKQSGQADYGQPSSLCVLRIDRKSDG